MSATERQIPAPLELRSFVDAIPTMAWSALADGSLDFFNQRFRDYVGLSPDQLYGLGWKSAVPRDDIQQLWMIIIHLLVDHREGRGLCFPFADSSALMEEEFQRTLPM
jgi:PAS domain S-box-containing protein